MRTKLFASLICLLSCLSLTAPASRASSLENSGFGQTIQIYTNLTSFVGNPVWLLTIYDIDNNRVLPYLYEITNKNDFWLAFSYSRNFRITISSLKFDPTRRKINDFCHLENYTMRGESLYITISGKLSPNTDTFTCDVSKYKDGNFSIAPSGAQDAT